MHGASIQRVWDGIEFKGLLALASPTLTLIPDVRTRTVQVIVTLSVPSAVDGKTIQVSGQMTAHTPVSNDWAMMGVRMAIQNAWLHELCEGTPLRRGGWLIEDPHPEGV